MKIQTGTNINCKPQTTFALSGIACFIAFLLSGTFAVAAPAPSVQPQKPDIRFGTDPVRPTDLESTPLTGFVDRTPKLFGSKVTLKTSIEDIDKDSILNYSKTDSRPISFSTNASLTFKDRKLRILAPSMTGGSAIEAINDSKVTIEGSAFEVYASDPKYLLRGYA